MNVSVALCTYDGMPYIREQLESIIRQTRTPDEIVICDDGSTDGTRKLLREYESRHDYIDLEINDDNLGITKNFEKCISRCQGDVIAICDQDDVWRENKLSRQVDVIQKTGVELTFHNTTIVNEQAEKKGNFWVEKSYPPGLISHPNRTFSRLLQGNFISGHTMLFRTSIRNDVLPIPSEWMYDRYIAIQSAMLFSIEDINEQLVLHRYHEDQKTNTQGPATGTIEKLRRGINAGFSYNGNPERWKILRDLVQDLNSDSMKINKEWALEQITDVLQYERNRQRVYAGSTNFFDGLHGVYVNTVSGGYERYGGANPVLHIVKDLIGAILIRFPQFNR